MSMRRQQNREARYVLQGRPYRALTRRRETWQPPIMPRFDPRYLLLALVVIELGLLALGLTLTLAGWKPTAAW